MKKGILILLIITQGLVLGFTIDITLDVEELIPNNAKYALVTDIYGKLLGTYILYDDYSQYFFTKDYTPRSDTHCLIRKSVNLNPETYKSDFWKKNDIHAYFLVPYANNNDDPFISHDGYGTSISEIVLRNSEIVIAYFDTGEVLEIFEYELIMPWLFRD